MSYSIATACSTLEAPRRPARLPLERSSEVAIDSYMRDWTLLRCCLRRWTQLVHMQRQQRLDIAQVFCASRLSGIGVEANVELSRIGAIGSFVSRVALAGGSFRCVAVRVLRGRAEQTHDRVCAPLAVRRT